MPPPTALPHARGRIIVGLVLALTAVLAEGASSIAAPVGSIDRPAASGSLDVAVRVDFAPIVCDRSDPVELGYDPFYTQHCSAFGLDVLGSAAVVPGAVERTAEIIVAMIGHRRDLLDEMIMAADPGRGDGGE